MKNKSISKIFIYLLIAFFIIIFFTVLSRIIGIEILTNIWSIVILAFISLILCPMLITVYKLIAQLFKNKKYIYTFCSMSVFLSIILFFLGIMVFFQGTPLSSEYKVDEVKVVESSWNRVQIDYTKYNKNDFKVITIKKPFFVNMNKGDLIEVMYPINNPSKMHYVLNNEIGLKLISISMTIFLFTFITAGIVIARFMIKLSIERKKGNGKK